jgi:hypothetical protein
MCYFGDASFCGPFRLSFGLILTVLGLSAALVGGGVRRSAWRFMSSGWQPAKPVWI